MRRFFFLAGLLAAVSCGSNFREIDSVVEENIHLGNIPGAVVAVVKGDSPVFLKAYGNAQTFPDTTTMTPDRVFDLASLTKCYSTAISVMQQVERGRIRLQDRVDYYIPGFRNWEDPETGEKDIITVQDLLTHTSGLPRYVNAEAFLEEHPFCEPDTLLNYICFDAERYFKPGTQQRYSCPNYIVLQKIMETVTGERISDYARKNIFEPLGLMHTGYLPLYETPFIDTGLCVPTEYIPGEGLLRGVVHDPTARLLMKGNSGNAGLFSNAHDLCILTAALMNGGAYRGRRILGRETTRRLFERPQDNDPSVSYAHGWDTYLDSGSIAGDIFNRNFTVGHTGYTGTSVVMDLEHKVAVIILSNRVHPEDKGSIMRMRACIANIVAGEI